jgi:hypothetical protein
MARPVVSSLTEDLYSALGWFTTEDEANDWALLKFCAAWVETLIDPVAELAGEGEDGTPAWSKLLDPDECPGAALPYLAQFVGVVITPEMSEAQIRAEITAPTGWVRGTDPVIRLTVQRTLTGEDPLVIIHSRTPEPGHHYIRTLLSQTPDPARTKALVRAAVPAWEELDYEAIEGVTWADIAASTKWETWAGLGATFASFVDLAEILPTEI